MQASRIHKLNDKEAFSGTVVYWLSRDQRAEDNWGLIYAQKLALELKSSLVVVFCLSPNYGGASIRKYSFMIESLKETKNKLKSLNIPFITLLGSPQIEIPRFVNSCNAGALVCDFDPIRAKQIWFSDVAKKINCAFYEADSHNIVPARLVSSKAEWAAYTLRPKLKRLLGVYLEEFPSLVKQTIDFVNNTEIQTIDLNTIDDDFLLKNKFCSDYPQKLSNLKVGADSAIINFKAFLNSKFKDYAEKRNNYTKDYQSGISPYLHFGIVAPQRIALIVSELNDEEISKDSFLEELIVRRELADNFCLYNPNYDNFNCAPDWAKKTLLEHRNDKRKRIYKIENLENAETGDELWDLAQKQAIIYGKPHGYLRMYWAKKLLEWCDTPDEAFSIAVYLNDKYCLDGLDPNGYAGIAWSIAGVHDRAWGEREIYGKLRYMSYEGLRKKSKI